MNYSHFSADELSGDTNAPVIFAYKIYKPDRFHYIKIGYTEKNPQVVIFMESEWARLTPEIILIDSAIKKDGSILTEMEFHNYLRNKGYKELQSGIDCLGWFCCEPNEVIESYRYLIEN